MKDGGSSRENRSAELLKFGSFFMFVDVCVSVCAGAMFSISGKYENVSILSKKENPLIKQM